MYWQTDIPAVQSEGVRVCQQQNSNPPWLRGKPLMQMQRKNSKSNQSFDTIHACRPGGLDAIAASSYIRNNALWLRFEPCLIPSIAFPFPRWHLWITTWHNFDLGQGFRLGYLKKPVTPHLPFHWRIQTKPHWKMGMKEKNWWKEQPFYGVLLFLTIRL